MCACVCMLYICFAFVSQLDFCVSRISQGAIAFFGNDFVCSVFSQIRDDIVVKYNFSIMSSDDAGAGVDFIHIAFCHFGSQHIEIEAISFTIRLCTLMSHVS